MKAKRKFRRLLIRSLDELPAGFVPMSNWCEHGRQTPAYGIIRRATRRGEIASAKLHADGRENEMGRVYVHEATALALLAAATTPPAKPATVSLFREPEAPDNELAKPADSPYLDLAERITAARTVAELGAVGDAIERHESAGTLAPVETAALMGAINGRHDELEPVAAVAASLATGDPGTVDRLATAMERMAEALEELLRRSRLEIDLDPCA